MIVITPTAGLCNRMRALDSALALGRAAGVPVRAVWKLNEDLNCRFEALFESVPGLEGLEYRDESVAASSPNIEQLRVATKKVAPLVFLVKMARRTKRAIRNANGNSRVLPQPEIKRLARTPDALVDLAARYDLYLDTYDRFFRGAEDYAGFRPVVEIREAVAGYALTRRTVGVHIRRTDHALSLAHSPTELFSAAMRRMAADDPTVQFFVASDSEAVEEALEAEFPGRIARQRNKAYTRNSAEGIRNAMIDLYCLASCGRIIGSYASSFTETASELGKVPCEVVERKLP